MQSGMRDHSVFSMAFVMCRYLESAARKQKAPARAEAPSTADGALDAAPDEAHTCAAHIVASRVHASAGQGTKDINRKTTIGFCCQHGLPLWYVLVQDAGARS